jgi:hypothetical protein
MEDSTFLLSMSLEFEREFHRKIAHEFYQLRHRKSDLK